MAWQMVTLAENGGGRGVWQMLILADKGEGGLTNDDSTDKML